MAAPRKAINIEYSNLLVPTFELPLPVKYSQLNRVGGAVSKALGQNFQTTLELANWLNETYGSGYSLWFHHPDPCINPQEESILYTEAGLTYCLNASDQEFIRRYQLNPYTGRRAVLDDGPPQADPAEACIDNKQKPRLFAEEDMEPDGNYSSRFLHRNGKIKRLKWPAADEVINSKPCKPVLVYRGLRFVDPPLEIEGLTRFDLVSAEPSSWSTSLEMAQKYASSTTRTNWLVLEHLAHPEDVLSTGPGVLSELRLRPGVYDVRVAARNP
jgi:hypothetical protein